MRTVILLDCILQLAKCSTTSLLTYLSDWWIYRRREILKYECDKRWKDMLMLFPTLSCSPQIFLQVKLRPQKCLQKAQSFLSALPGVCIVASCLLCWLLCWEWMGTSKWNWIHQCHTKNRFASHIPLCSSNLLDVVSGVCWANVFPLAVCSGWVLALDYQHEIRCWPAAYLLLRRRSASNPYWVTWKVGLVPEVPCHGFSWEMLSRFPRQQQKALCPV